MLLYLFRACMVNDNVGMTCGFSFWALTILVYDAHVMIFFTWTKFETLMYELMCECMMKVPLLIFFFSQKWMMYVWLNMNLCMKHALMYFFTFYIVWNLFQLILNLLLFLDLWNPSVLIFFFEKYSLVWLVYWETIFCTIAFWTLFEWHTRNCQSSWKGLDEVID